MVVVLKGSDAVVRMIGLQFSFSNESVVPPSVKRLGLHRETREEHEGRKGRSSGVMVIAPRQGCSLVKFIGDLDEAGYTLVDALYEERIHPEDPSGKKTYHMVRFWFARREFSERLSLQFKRVRGVIHAELRKMAEDAIWRVRAFSNPFYKDGEEVHGARALLINIEVRQPLFCPNGQPEKMWEKDKSGRRVGDAPRPIAPDCHLRVEDGVVRLM